MAEPRPWVTDPAEIYRRSFAIIRAEADLKRFSAEEETVAVAPPEAEHPVVVELVAPPAAPPGHAVDQEGLLHRRDVRRDVHHRVEPAALASDEEGLVAAESPEERRG